MRFFALLFILISQASVAQISVKNWSIGDYRVELIESFNERVDFGMDFNFKEIQRNNATIHRSFVVKHFDKEIVPAGTLRMSKDSCVLSFLEYTSNRPKNGHVGDYVELDLCNLSEKVRSVIKPIFDPKEMSNVTIKPLDSIFYQPYSHLGPARVVLFENGQSRALHMKNIEGLAIFMESMWIFNVYREEEFVSPLKPRFEIVWEENGKHREMLLYWNYFIVDGFMYSNNSSNNDNFDIRFWEANLKLLGLL